jgi:hypothetical protein
MALSEQRQNLKITYDVELFAGLGIDDMCYVIIVDDINVILIALSWALVGVSISVMDVRILSHTCCWRAA